MAQKRIAYSKYRNDRWDTRSWDKKLPHWNDVADARPNAGSRAPKSFARKKEEKGGLAEDKK